jgi:hypothetical protein
MKSSVRQRTLRGPKVDLFESGETSKGPNRMGTETRLSSAILPQADTECTPVCCLCPFGNRHSEQAANFISIPVSRVVIGRSSGVNPNQPPFQVKRRVSNLVRWRNHLSFVVFYPDPNQGVAHIRDTGLNVNGLAVVRPRWPIQLWPLEHIRPRLAGETVDR